MTPLKSDWQMPYVEIGMPVIWYHEGNKDCPHAAICTAVGHYGIDLNVFAPDTVNTKPMSGVCHVSDPRLIRTAITDSGTWDYPRWLRMLLEIARNYPTGTAKSKVPSPPKTDS